MKEYECIEYNSLKTGIIDLLSDECNVHCTVIESVAEDILDLLIEKSNYINEQLKFDNEKLTLKMIEIENATKGYFKKIEEVMN